MHGTTNLGPALALITYDVVHVRKPEQEEGYARRIGGVPRQRCLCAPQRAVEQHPQGG
jgi:hypothetical protein